MMSFSRSCAVLAALLSATLTLGGCGQRQQTAAHSKAGALAKLKPETPKRVPHVSFAGADGRLHSLRQFRGRYVLLNLWATWCAPCVRELPALARLKTQLGPRRVAILPVNIGRATPAETASFLKTNQAAALPVYMDKKNEFLRTFGAFGLPLTVLIDPHGHEIARALGAVKWDAPESVRYFNMLGRRQPNTGR